MRNTEYFPTLLIVYLSFKWYSVFFIVGRAQCSNVEECHCYRTTYFCLFDHYKVCTNWLVTNTLASTSENTPQQQTMQPITWTTTYVYNKPNHDGTTSSLHYIRVFYNAETIQPRHSKTTPQTNTASQKNIRIVQPLNTVLPIFSATSQKTYNTGKKFRRTRRYRSISTSYRYNNFTHNLNQNPQTHNPQPQKRTQLSTLKPPSRLLFYIYIYIIILIIL
jgi:hypothetical protein